MMSDFQSCPWLCARRPHSPSRNPILLVHGAQITNFAVIKKGLGDQQLMPIANQLRRTVG